MKIKVMKNLYQFISSFAAILMLDTPLLVGYFISLSSFPNYGWVLLLVALSIIILYFGVGIYWICQIVIIDDTGIKILFFNKVIKYVAFEDIKNCKFTNVMRNPSITIFLENKKHINLDQRKQITNCLKYYGIEILNDDFVI